MINHYLNQFEITLKNSKIVLSYHVNKKIINDFLLILEGNLKTSIGILDFLEVIRYDGVKIIKKKYKYNFRDYHSELIFRYDNAPHHSQIKTFPHHLHIDSQVFESSEPTIQEILQKIQENNL